MPKMKANSYVGIGLAAILIGAGYWTWHNNKNASESTGSSAASAVPSESPVQIAVTAPAKKSLAALLQQYGSLPLADMHNHDASDKKYLGMKDVWQRNGMDRVVLFGDVSEYSAIRTDEYAWEAYTEKPDFFVPFFSGFDLRDKSSLEVIRKNLEMGYLGLGEIAGASYNSPVLSKVEWKAKHPMDGFLPQIYELCAEYQAPILLHIDPPNGFVLEAFEEALKAHPKTTFIFGHANAYNSPDNIKILLEKYPNVYMDFFAGFTLLNPESANRIEDFLPVMKQFPDRFMLSTDSGYGVQSEEAAIEAMYRVLDALGDSELVSKIAYGNLDGILRKEPATQTQKAALLKRDPSRDMAKLSKLEAGQLLWGKEK
ncbi:amidohydrolase [Paenibacillus sp. HWE-109]|uniref:amidohydrolase family protein n=1 Tax=Paenibacillus sp. HWE-109 TaxID=1306526 RepID=UPI001EDD2258|nr:amidohydrolase family protein [Paenibacillus sp. HWE-109]UKS25843.1 amidohydrolase [Paenibacillus sp. HWE-109]